MRYFKHSMKGMREVVFQFFCAIFSARVPVTADEMSDMAEVKKELEYLKNNFL